MNNLSGWLKRNLKKFRLDRESNLDLCDDRTQGFQPLRLFILLRRSCSVSYLYPQFKSFHIFQYKDFSLPTPFFPCNFFFVFKNLLLFVLSATSESVDGMVKALWTFRRTQASLSIKEGKSALQVKCSLNGHVTFSLASHPNRDPPL